MNIFLGVELLLYLQSSYHETLIIIFIQNDNKLENVYVISGSKYFINKDRKGQKHIFLHIF